MYGLSMPGPSRSIRETLSFRDDFSKMLGAHAFKMGYEHLDFRGNYWQLGQPSGTFLFDNMTAGLQASGAVATAYPGNQFAAWELGSVRQANFTTYTTTWLPRDGVDSLYFQDDWKFSRNLTFNVGLRWSTESPFHTAHGLESNFSPTTVDPLNQHDRYPLPQFAATVRRVPGPGGAAARAGRSAAAVPTQPGPGGGPV
jgi:hypothetical protein